MAADGRECPRRGARRRDAPSWSPDGKWIAVVASEGREQPLFKVAVDGGVSDRLAGGINYNPVWSPDGRFIAYSEHHGGPRYQLKGVTEKQPLAAGVMVAAGAPPRFQRRWP
jgi:Tol biopolymer transport system component